MVKEQAFYRSVRRVAAVLNSSATLKQVLDAIVRAAARAMESGASIVLLDATGKKLIHGASWKLPQTYLQKGVLDVEKSVTEVLTGKPVAIADVCQDNRIEYPELAAKFGIVSLLGVPIIVDGIVVGSIRVYSKERRDFSTQDVAFVTTLANLSAAAIRKSRQPQESGERTDTGIGSALSLVRQAQTLTFAHPSEKEFADILDFYHIEWAYEPRSFPLSWEGDRVTEMFAPDFYLPGLDLYVELTTLKQKLVTDKNRKLRRLRELYPEIKISLLYKRDFDRLLAKYGCGPLAQARGHGISKVLYSEGEIQQRVQKLADQISRDYSGRRPVMIGVLRGVLCFMADLIRRITIPLDVEFLAISYYAGSHGSTVRITKDINLDLTTRHVIMVEDIVDTGMTLSYVLDYLRAKKPATLVVCTLLDKRVRRIVDVPLDYIGFRIPDEFVVGYGLDYKEEYRNLPFIGVVNTDKEVSEEQSLL